MEPTAGQTLSHYKVLERLGAGGMGVVHKARDIRLNRLVALKFLSVDKTADPAGRARFIKEAQAASALNHPNIVTIFEVDRDGDCDFIVMELIAGRTLDRIIGRNLEVSEALTYAIQIADALAAAHAAGIVHRDLKPGNVMVTEAGAVKILDFGLAKLTEPSVDPEEQTVTLHRSESPLLTKEGAIFGTVSYMSPEQVEGKQVDWRSDIFSFGSLLYEMLSGRPAFLRDSQAMTVTAILRDDPTPLTELSIAVSSDLQKIVVRCLRKDVSRRFQHMRDVQIALEEVKEELDSGQVGNAVPTLTPRRSKKLLYSGIISALVLTVAWLGWQVVRYPGPPRDLTLRPLTQDSGITSGPAISPDGKLVAYTSNRAGDGNMDIWIQQVSHGAQPVRLTRNKAEDLAPAFSPDGGQIAFWSSRDGGGIYIMPALGGEERLLLRGTYIEPRFSPDGRWIAACAVGSSAGNEILLVPAAGGAARKIAEGYYAAGPLLWSPDGKRILFAGWPKQGGQPDWWVQSLDGEIAAATGLASVLKPSGDVPSFGEWLDDYILYSTGNLWRVRFSASSLRVSGKPEHLTTSSNNESTPRAVSIGKSGNWRIVFSAAQLRPDLGRLPLDANRGITLGEPERMFRDGLQRVAPSLCADESRLLYLFHAVDTIGARVRNLKTGTETTVVQSPVWFRARLSPDGSTVAYNPSDNVNESVIHLVPADGGNPKKLCDNCGLIYSWTPDGKEILFRKGSPIRFHSFNPTTGQQQPLVTNAKNQVLGISYSPDRRWLAMQYGRGESAPRALFILPAGKSQTVPESQWIAVMDRPGMHTRPWWSPDANRLYFLSNAGGQLDIWSQRLKPDTKQPIGDPEMIYHPPPDRLVMEVGSVFGPGVASRSLIFPMSEPTGNVWLAE